MNVEATENGSIHYGKRNIDFLIKHASRKTMEISVYPDKSVVVIPPLNTDYKAICEKVKKRARWILKQKAFFNQFQPRTPARQYIGGETHLFLGKAHRLKIVKGKNNSIKLKRGYFEIECIDSANLQIIRSLFLDWYRKKSEFHYTDILENLRARFKIKKDDIKKMQIKKMKTRWGSLSKSSVLTLNANLIKAPKECIEYVITHELCHLKHDNHGKEFFSLLKKRIPDWEFRKEKLEKIMK